MTTRKALLLVLLIIGLAASAFVAVQRVRVESRNRAVDIVIDYGEVAQIVAATGEAPVEVLTELERAGATSVAITEDTVRDLIEERLIIPEGERSLSVDAKVAARVAEHLDMDLADGDRLLTSRPAAGGSILLTIRENIPLAYVETLPVGLSEEALTQVRAAGLEPVARLVNYAGVTPAAIDGILADVDAIGISKVIFFGDQVLGYRGATKETANALLANGLYCGRVEFSKQKGETDIARRAKPNVIVVHSISQNEMPAMDQQSIADRFAKGVKERGVRMCYVRFLDTASGDMLGTSKRYISSIAREITKAGYETKGSHPVGEVRVPRVVRSAAGLGVAAGVLLLVLAIADLSAAAMILWTAGAVIVCAGFPMAGEMGRKMIALLSALVFPTLAGLQAIKGAPDSPTAAPGAAWRALGRLVLAVLTAAAGGVLIVGLLSSQSFMLRVNQFAGIKLAHMAPILALAALFAGGIAWKSDRWAAQRRRLVGSYYRLAANPVLVWQAAGLLGVLVVIGMVVARSGNDAGLQVSPLELKFRAILDRVMVVRPRTKELIGYPLLFVGIAYALRGRRQWAAPLVVVGSIGLISALNTFCHIHTPLMVSVFRVLNGTICGAVIGGIAYWIVKSLPGKEGK